MLPARNFSYPTGFIGPKLAARLLGLPVGHLKRFAAEHGIEAIRFDNKRRTYAGRDVRRKAAEASRKIEAAGRKAARMAKPLRSRLDRESLARSTSSNAEGAGPWQARPLPLNRSRIVRSESGVSATPLNHSEGAPESC